ncbi:hypothetical protein C8A05DRAFT_19907 [Staphylotrichum tortipilum]|uniref:Uncharacterized protein n=1 Tax=Staphylotrichum tortipilum TaxID=2831512 RepID=A0AAN6RNT8_9PEZI|nr:hypothetical protein C8A05DRAFT_19907 [Staphylotrichum longicolle]
MRLSAVLPLLFWAGLASAYGIRASYERAMYFLIYELEDMLAIPGVGEGGYQVAPGCLPSWTGETDAEGNPVIVTRRGLLGRSKRCTLAQFLDHTWRKTSTKVDVIVGFDTKPVPEKVQWLGSDDVRRGSGMTVSQIQTFVMNAKGEDGEDLIRKVKVEVRPGVTVEVKQHGYTGNVDEPGKLWPNAHLPSGMDGYLASMDQAATRAKQLAGYWKKAIADGKINLDNKDHKTADKRVRKYFDDVKTAATKTHLFRQEDLHRYMKENGNWKAAFGVEPTWVLKESGDAQVANWYELNKEDTVAAIKTAKGVNDVEAERIYEEKWNAVTGSVGYQGHNAAIAAAKNVVDELKTINLDCK